MLEEYSNQLLAMIEKHEGQPLNASTTFNFYSFDVMGRLAFGKGFNMLKEGIIHYYMESIHSNMLAIGAFSHLVWIFPLLKAIPIVNREQIKFQKWLDEQVNARRAVTLPLSLLGNLMSLSIDKMPLDSHTLHRRRTASVTCSLGSWRTTIAWSNQPHRIWSTFMEMRIL